MRTFLSDLFEVFTATCVDILPIILLITLFQLLVLKQPIPNLKKLITGGIYVVIGLSLFILGLELALFPMGRIMAEQLAVTALPETVSGAHTIVWTDFFWAYLFAALIGFATTIAEPSLIAVAIKANEVSGGTIKQWGLRVTVAIGVAVGLALGTFRLVTGTPLYIYILAGYLIVIVQTFFTPKSIIPLAYDSGGVTTSTVTVPIVTALGLGLSASIPGRNPAIDGFGLIAFASLFPIITVLGYAQYAYRIGARDKK